MSGPHRSMRLMLGACCLLAISVCASSAAVSSSQQAAATGRKLKQVTFFYETPAAAGSTSLDTNARLGVRPDGTVHAGGGTSVTSTDAISNPFLQWITDGAYDNRPQAATATYNQIPLALQSTQFPTLSYGLAEGQGDAASRAGGAWGTVEFGYNPISNNLGTSVSTGTSNSLNVGANERIGSADPSSDGIAGIEFAGFSNDLSNLADARTDQSGQAIAFPNNLVSPINPLTCTQSLLYGITFSNYDLGAPLTPTPREDPGSTLIPYCLQFFNFGTMDDFANFVDEDTDYELNFDNNGDGIINGLRGRNSISGIPGGRLFNEEDAPPEDGSPETTTTTSTLTAPPVTAGSTNRQQKPDSSVRQTSESDAASAESPNSRSRRSRRKSRNDNRVSADGQRPVPNDARAAAILPQRGGDNVKRVDSFGDVVDRAVQNGSPELRAFAQTRMGSALIDRFKSSPAAHASDKTVDMLANAAARGVVGLAQPIANLTSAARNLTNGVGLNATTISLKAAVTGLEAVQPLFQMGRFASNRLGKVANASNEVAANLARRSSEMLQKSIAALPKGELKNEAQAAASTISNFGKPGAGAGGVQNPKKGQNRGQNSGQTRGQRMGQRMGHNRQLKRVGERAEGEGLGQGPRKGQAGPQGGRNMGKRRMLH